MSLQPPGGEEDGGELFCTEGRGADAWKLWRTLSLRSRLGVHGSRPGPPSAIFSGGSKVEIRFKEPGA